MFILLNGLASSFFDVANYSFKNLDAFMYWDPFTSPSLSHSVLLEASILFVMTTTMTKIMYKMK